jgi:signal transduction histidine kinase/ActR/RegA family two-component response regulator
MSSRQHPSIRRQLTLTIALTSALALALAAAALVVYDLATYRQALARDLEALADLIGNNSTAALTFGDSSAAGETLASLSARSDVEAAALYTAAGHRLASYATGRAGAPMSLAELTEGTAGGFFVVRDVKLDGQTIGRVFVRSNADQLEARVWRTIGITSVVFLLSVGIAVTVGDRLQLRISRPIQQLSAAALQISSTRDYALRIGTEPRVRELDVLVRTFDDMLAQIQARDLDLRRHQDRLEEKVAVRTAQLTEAKDKAESASRAKSDFLANMSHELRTPMNGVLGTVDLALEQASGPVREQLETIRASGEALLRIIDEVLDFSTIEAGTLRVEPVPTALGALVSAATDRFAARAQEKGVALTLDLHRDLPAAVLVDPVRLRQVLVNLVGNSVKFTASGAIVITVRPDGTAPDGRQRIAFIVRDTGIGIEADRLESIFQPFTQADGSMTRRYGGTGLGLTLSSRLVVLMGGTIAVRSTPGDGSVFTVVLPMAVEVQESAEASPLAARDRIEGRRVLVAEDNPVNQRIAQQMLRKRKLEVTLADDGRQAVSAFEAARFDLVLMDVQMPEMNGFDAVAAIRALEHAQGRPHTPIVAVTAHAMHGDRERCIEAGMDAYLSKPIRTRQLYDLVDSLLGREDASRDDAA